MILKSCEYCGDKFEARLERTRFCDKTCTTLARGSTPYKDGVRSHPLYGRWASMIQRCYNPNNTNYHWYGGRGITVCDEWRESSWKFINDMEECPEGYSLDRIDNDGPYSAENCRWTDAKTQANNRKRVDKS